MTTHALPQKYRVKCPVCKEEYDHYSRKKPKTRVKICDECIIKQQRKAYKNKNTPPLDKREAQS